MFQRLDCCIPGWSAVLATSLNAALADAARRTPEAPAVLWRDQPLAFRDLEARIAIGASRLFEAGVEAGDVVGITLGSGLRHLLAQYAVGALGACSLPLHPGLGEATRAELVARYKVRHVLCGDAGAPAGGAQRLLFTAAPRAGERLRAPPREPHAEDPYCILLTSGTTGTPKGIRYTHAAMLARGVHDLPDCDAATRLLVPNLHLSVGHVYPPRVLNAGGTLVFSASPALEDFIATLRRHGVTLLLQSPFAAEGLLAGFPRAGRGLPALRQLRIVGGAAPPALLDALRERITPNVHVSYATTEIGVIALADPQALSRAPRSAGRAMPGTDIEIVDGQVRVRAAGMPTEYFPAVHGAGFRDGWYWTGDTGSLDGDGLLTIAGRVDDQINLGGHKLQPAFVEEALAGHPDVAEVAAFALPGPGATPILAAAIVARGAQMPPDLEAYAKAALGRFAPACYLLVTELPRTASGKVLRAQLARAAQARL